MKEYVLQQVADKLVLKKNGQEVPPTDILAQYPDRRVFAFDGAMGAGKTTFIRTLCEALGVQDVVNSPTFAIVNVYEDQHQEPIYHFDCYRLKSIAEAMDFGAEEYLYSGSYCLVEWPDIIERLLPEDTVKVALTVLPNGDRKLTLSALYDEN